MNNSRALRETLRQTNQERRRGLSREAFEIAARALCDHLVTTQGYQTAQKIAAYIAVNGEIGTGPVMKQVIHDNKRLFLPVVVDSQLRFAPYELEAHTLLNRYRIPEPDVPSKRLIDPVELNLVLVPLVAFDSAGNRLGTGGGFYDRSFAFRRESAIPMTPILVGAAYEFQRVESLPTQSWDVALDFVVTERGIHHPTGL